LIPVARIERPEFPVGRSTREDDVAAGHEKRRPEDGLEVVLPDALARIQVPDGNFLRVTYTAASETTQRSPLFTQGRFEFHGTP
jgi:hypothetical protein